MTDTFNVWGSLAVIKHTNAQPCIKKMEKVQKQQNVYMYVMLK